jgi:hypothetical protein
VAMRGGPEQAAGTDVSPLRSWIIKHPIACFLVLVYVTNAALVFVPGALTQPGLLPGGATPHGVLENVLGSAVPAFIVTALVGGRYKTWLAAACDGEYRCAGTRLVCWAYR